MAEERGHEVLVYWSECGVVYSEKVLCYFHAGFVMCLYNREEYDVVLVFA